MLPNIMPSENSQFDFDIETNSLQVERRFKKVPIESKQEHLEPCQKNQDYVILSKLSLHYINLAQKLKMQDYIWEVSFNMFNKISMWTGWNVINSTNLAQKQIVCYMKPIQLSPTRTDVVKETMKCSIDIANTVKQRQAFVKYNLAIAKIPKRIQSEEFRTYDKLFIMFGSFYIELFFFHCLENLLKV